MAPKPKTRVGQYVLNVLIGLDQFGNCFWGGDPDETISSRLGKIKARHGGKIPWSRPLPRVIDWGLEKIDPGHSIRAREFDEGKDSVFDRRYQ